MRWRHVCAGEERRTLRKSAFCTLGLTERRILRSRRDGKVHSVLIDSRKGALCDSQIAQNALFCYVAAPGRCGATPRQAAGHYGECLNWANALEQPPASLRGGLCQGPQISVRSLTSRKDAFWLLPHGKAHSPSPHHQNPQSDGSEDCRMLFSVTFHNHPDCVALSRHLRNPLMAPSHVRGGHRSARRRLRASAQSKEIRPPARHGSRTRV